MRQERRALQLRILALAHDPKHGLLRLLQIVQEDALKLAAAVGILGRLLQLPQRQREVALEDLLPERGRTAEEAVRQPFNLAHAELVSAERSDDSSRFNTPADALSRRFFMQPGDSLIDPSLAGHAVLSHGPGEHLHDLCQTEPAPFDEAGHHPDMRQDGAGPGQPRLSAQGRSCRRDHLGRDGWFTPLGVLLALLLLIRAIVGDTAAGRLAFAMGFPTAEGAAQIPALGVAPVREKENAAVPAAFQALAQSSLGSHNRPQQHVIREDQRGDWAVAIPVRGKPKILRDLDCKKPRLRLWTLL